MISYFFVLLAVILCAASFVFNKKYQADCGEGLRTCCVFNLLNGLMTAVFFFLIGGFSLAVTPYSLFHAFLQALIGGSYVILGFRILAEGTVAVYTMFLMLGAMLLPYGFGILFLEEPLTPCRGIGAVILAGALIAFSFSENSQEAEKKPSKKFWFLCIAVFCLNGLLSIVTKIHQVDTRFPTVGENDFVILSGLMKAVLFAAVLPFTKPAPKGQNSFGSLKSFGYVAAISVLGGASTLFQLYGAADLDASVMYPMLTGGMVVLTALAGRIFFGEKLSFRSVCCIGLMFAATFLFLW